MSAVWTQQQDDKAAFDEAMEVADVSLRQLQAVHDKLRNMIGTLHRATRRDSREGQYGRCLSLLDHIEALLESPPVARWRQQHSEGRGKRHSQQHVLEVKLAFARELLTDRGVDLDAELATRRLGS